MYMLYLEADRYLLHVLSKASRLTPGLPVSEVAEKDKHQNGIYFMIMANNFGKFWLLLYIIFLIMGFFGIKQIHS